MKTKKIIASLVMIFSVVFIFSSCEQGSGYEDGAQEDLLEIQKDLKDLSTQITQEIANAKADTWNQLKYPRSKIISHSKTSSSFVYIFKDSTNSQLDTLVVIIK